MIGKGASRDNAPQLGHYLLNEHDGESARVLQVRGTIADDVKGAMEELEAIAKGTRCEQHMYHAILNPERGQSFTDAQKFYAIEVIAKQLGLDQNARVVVEHEKDREQHIHIAFSRINPDTLKSVRMSHDRLKIHLAARIIEHDLGHRFVFTGQHDHVMRQLRAQGREDVAEWMERERVKMLEQPALQRSASRSEEEQSHRLMMDLKQVRADIRGAWEQSDNGAAFRQGLEGKGYLLARGDRRDYVVIDEAGGVHSVARCLSKEVKAANVRERLADLANANVPDVETARALQAQHRNALSERQREHPEPMGMGELVGLADKLAEQLTYHRAYFSEDELNKAVSIMQKEAAQDGKDAGDLRQVFFTTQAIETLYDRNTEEATQYYTTLGVRCEEEETLARAVRMAEEKAVAVDSATTEVTAKERTLDDEQMEAVRYVTSGNGRLHILEGRAGTGKSHTIGAVRESFEREGCRVIGLAPTNAVVNDMQRDGFIEARTVHSLLWHAEHGTADGTLARGDVLIVDEAAMIDTRTLGKLLTHADKSGARVILVGDDRQLASVERGGLFGEIRNNVGSTSLTIVRRQRDEWAREASEDFAAGRFAEGLAAYDKQGCIHWQDTPDKALNALVERWKDDTEVSRGKQFVFAYTNQHVDLLNTTLQGEEIARGRVGALHEFKTSRGDVLIGEGDRVQFRATDKQQGILNGVVGTMTEIKGDHCTVMTDAGQKVRFDKKEFAEIGLGYAGTIYKGQGKTLDNAYLLHSYHWRDQASYVAMTRATHGTQLFVDRETVSNTTTLAAQMARVSGSGSSLQFATKTELQEAVDWKNLERTQQLREAHHKRQIETEFKTREKEVLAKIQPSAPEAALSTKGKISETVAKAINPKFKTRDERQHEKEQKHLQLVAAKKAELEQKKQKQIADFMQREAVRRNEEKKRMEELQAGDRARAARQAKNAKTVIREAKPEPAIIVSKSPDKDIGRER
ncbi:MAG: AAA family ATPase [Rickettsiales bacterium]